MNNTYQQGTATIFTYKKGDKYIGVCLELDLVDESDNLDNLQNIMKERVMSYVRYVRDTDSGNQFLNKPAPAEYWRLFRSYLNYLQEINLEPSVRIAGDHPEGAAVETYPIRQLMHA